MGAVSARLCRCPELLRRPALAARGAGCVVAACMHVYTQRRNCPRSRTSDPLVYAVMS